MSIQYRYQSLSDVGLVRANNEDALLVSEKAKLFAVCDGLGGHAAGEVASLAAVEELRQKLEGNSGAHEEQLRSVIQSANRRILNLQQETPELQGMGTTMSVLWLSDNQHASCWIGHVGDSRIYRLRHGELDQLTRDHSPVFRLFLEGRLSKDEIRFHPRKNLIERSLGQAETVECDILSAEVLAGDRFLICSDGLSDLLSDEEIRKVLQSTDWAEICTGLVGAAKEKGGHDNVTVIVVDILSV